MAKVIIAVDLQNDFIDGSLGTKEAREMLPRLIARLEQALLNHEDIIFTQDTHTEEYLQTQEGQNLPVEHCIKPRDGWQLASSLQKFVPAAKKVVEKPTFGAVDLPPLVASYDEIELVGLCTDICVISNALLLKAVYPEKHLSVDASCCAGVTPESHRNALQAMKMCQIKIVNE